MGKTLLLVTFMVLVLCLNAYAQAEMMPLALGNPVSAKPTSDFLEAVNFDSEGRGDVFTNKLGDGVLNIATCWTDVPKRAEQVSQERSVLEGYTVGIGEGILSGIVRGASGTIDTATCIFPPYDNPMMQPEYSVRQPTKDGLKITLLSW